MAAGTESLDAELLKDLRGLGKPPSFDGNEAEMRSRAESDLPDSSESSGSVRTLIRSVEETNGLEAWRLIHSRYAPDTQNRQHTLMQKIMMLAKLWSDHTEGFESGLRSWELDVGEWERASGTAFGRCSQVHSDDEYGPDFLRNSLQLGTYANSTALHAALFSRNFGANPNRVLWK